MREEENVSCVGNIRKKITPKIEKYDTSEKSDD